MVNCLVNNCSSRSSRKSDKKISFYSIPKVIVNQCLRTKEKRRFEWLQIIKRPDLLNHNGRYLNKVCSKHFITGAPASLMDVNSPDWIPTSNLGDLRPSFKSKLLKSAQRHQRVVKRSRQKLILQHSSSIKKNVPGPKNSSMELTKSDKQNNADKSGDIEIVGTMDSTLTDSISPTTHQEFPNTINELSDGVNTPTNNLMEIFGDYSDKLIPLPTHISCEVKPSIREISTQIGIPQRKHFSCEAKPSVREVSTQTESECSASPIKVQY